MAKIYSTLNENTSTYGGVPDKPTDKMNHEKMENYMNFKLKIQDYFVVA